MESTQQRPPRDSGHTEGGVVERQRRALRRLRHENHLLRRQLLRMQEERRVLKAQQQQSHCSMVEDSAMAAKAGGGDDDDGTGNPRPHPSGSGGVVDDMEARPQQQGEGPPLLLLPSSVSSSLGARDKAKTSSSSPLVSTKADGGDDGHSRRPPSSPSSVDSVASTAATGPLVCRDRPKSDEEEGDKRLDEGPSSAGNGTTRTGPLERAMPPSAPDAALAGPASPSASTEAVERTHPPSSVNHHAASRVGGDRLVSAFTECDPHAPATPTAANADDDDNDDMQQQRNEAHEVMQRAASRRAMRRQRLERLTTASVSSSFGDTADGNTTRESTKDGPLDDDDDGGGGGGGGGSPRAKAVEPRRERRASTTSTAEDHDGPGSGAASEATTPSPQRKHLFAAARATAPSCNNPNQIGVEVSEEVKDRGWYLKQVIAQALLRAIRPSSRGQRRGRTATTTGDAGTGRAAAAAGPSLEDKRNGEAAEARPLGLPPPPPAQNPSLTTSSKAASPTTTAAAASSRFVYADIQTVAMRRAIADCLSMRFHCRRNRPCLSTDDREGPHSVSAGRLGAFADDNTDPNLLAAFSPQPHTRPPSSGLARGRSDGLNRDWDDEPDTSSGGASPRSPLPGGERRCHGGDSSRHRTDQRGNADAGEAYREDEVLVHFHSPVLFSQVRSFLRLDDNFLRASIEHAVWRQSTSPGKSNTTLYYFADFVLKTVKEGEVGFFQKHFLPYYVQYCERNPHTLLPRFYALITVRWLKSKASVSLILMQNVFSTQYYIHRIYDVKGSTVGRSGLTRTTKVGADGTEQSVLSASQTAFGALLLKDNDLPPKLVMCGPYQRAILLAQFQSDLHFLSSLNVVDYSCMIGVRSRVFNISRGPSRTVVLRRRRSAASYPRRDDGAGRRGNRYGASASANRGSGSCSDGEEDGESFVTQSVADLGTGSAPRTAATAYGYRFGAIPPHETPGFTVPTAMTRGGDGTDDDEDDEDDLFVCLRGCDGGLLSLPIYGPGDDTTAREDVYYLGIIDVLQEYNSIKKLESFAKGLMNDRRQISIIPPKDYAERLYKVLERITA